MKNAPSFLAVLLIAACGGIVSGALLLTFMPKSSVVYQSSGTGSPAGTTFSNAKIAEVAMAPTSATATSTSIRNSDASDRYVLDAGVFCSGLTTMFGLTNSGLSTFQWYAGTTSSAAPTTSIAGNLLLAMNVTVATSSAVGFTATSTYTNANSRVWSAGSYMTFQTNGTSTAASCTPFVHYIGS